MYTEPATGVYSAWRLHGQYLNPFHRIKPPPLIKTAGQLMSQVWCILLQCIWWVIFSTAWATKNQLERYCGTKIWLTNSCWYLSSLFVYIKYRYNKLKTVYMLCIVLHIKVIWKFELLCTGSKSQVWRTFKPVIKDHIVTYACDRTIQVV